MRPCFLLMLFSFCGFFQPAAVRAQSTRKQIRGQVSDALSKTPIGGATIALVNDSGLFSLTDDNGFFSLDAPLGRQSISISHVGYEVQVIHEILVTAGKEVDVQVSLIELVTPLAAVVVTSSSKRTLNNEMVTVSGRTFNAEDARKFAGSLGDPSRMVAGFAGVSSADDSRNDIIVRGNSPSGVLWRMEGLDIPNPNHYGSLSSTGGPVSILNTNTLGKSDFLTGAFPAAYSNVLSAVFDLQMRNGNSNQHEFLAEISFTGFEMGAEGPLSKKKTSSYLVNYRYSTLGVLNTVGLNFGTGDAVPQYQDLNFKLRFKVGAKSTLSFFGLGGPSKVSFLGDKEADGSGTNLYGAATENLFTHYATGIIGGTIETNFNPATSAKLTIGVSGTSETIQHDTISATTRIPFRDSEHAYKTRRASLNYTFYHKLNLRNSMVIGARSSLTSFNLFEKRIFGNGAPDRVNLDGNHQLVLIQAFAEGKHRITENMYVNAGLHFQTLPFNGTSVLEPRLGFRCTMPHGNVLSFGYGVSSLAQSPLTYFLRTQNSGQTTQTNAHLKFTKSAQFVMGYEYKLTSSILLKTEIYHQKITRAPVETKSNGFSLLNDGAGFGSTARDSLVSNGTGRNYGVEFTLEKYFIKGYYFLAALSFFDSKYTGSDGIERNSAFNTKYAINVLWGQEFKVGRQKNNIFSPNIKVTRVGGKYLSPVNIAASQNNYTTVYDDTVAPFSLKQAPYFRMDLKLGYRKNIHASTLEFGVNLQNVTMHKNLFIQKYNKQKGTIEPQWQQDFLPVPYFRLTF